MNQWPALHAWKNAAVEVSGKLLATQYQAASRPAQSLMRCRSDKFAVWNWRGMQAHGDQSGDMSNVGHQFGTDTSSDLADPLKIDRPRIGRRTADEQFRLALFGDPLQFVIIDLLRFAINAVVSDL